MNKVIQKTKWMSVGLLLTLGCGAIAVADDTELLLINPNEDTQTTPNVLLIIDSSGSMSTEEETREVYDSTQIFVGGAQPCDPNYVYWTPYKRVTPSCDPANTRRILKTSYNCAASTAQLAGIGIYRNRMVQFRDGTSAWVKSKLANSVQRWQTLRSGNETDIVECRKDSGIHGDGSGAGAVYAQAGGDVTPYTSLAKREIDWRSWPTSQSVTIYDGNYLNYLENPVLVQKSRINIVIDTANAILNSISGINVGIMRFNNMDGGPVIQAMTDLDTNRATILNTVNSIVAGGRTPVSETLYEAARYWRGLPAYYGENINENPTDPAALVSSGPEVYFPPEGEVCTRNFNVVLTDGEPVDDLETPSLVDGLPNWFGTLGYAGCTGTNEGDCLDDIAEYLLLDDISAAPGNQTVITNTIGFSINLPILQEAALRGGGDYFLADDVQSLTLALLEIVNNITDTSMSFAAPAVAVNTFNRTRNLNDLYLTTFAARETFHWPGNLKKYRISDAQVVDRNLTPAVDPLTGLFYDTSASFWSSGTDGNDVNLGGAVENLPDPVVRNLFTDNTVDPDLGSAANALTSSNVSSFALADFGLTGAALEPTIDELIRWARGEDVLDEDLNAATTTRKAMGDPLHSQPAAVVYGGTPTNPDVVVFSATNDGYVHATDASNGDELWAFIPKEFLANLQNLYFNVDTSYKNYGVDGDIVSISADRDNDGIIESADGDFVYIIFGLRRGGTAYYALDVTDRNRPIVKWRIDAAEIGQSWSRPVVAKMDIADLGLNSDKAVVVIGGGYDTVHDTLAHPASADTQGAGIYFLDLQSGDILWRAGPDNGANLQLAGMTRAIPSQIATIDLNGDNFADRLYASDMGGQILRFDIFKGKDPAGTGADALVTGGVIAQLGAEGQAVTDADTRRFYTSPDISIFNDNVQNRRYIGISIGSGYRSHPLDNTNDDRFYSIRDPNVFNQMTQAEYDSYTPIDDAELVEVSGQVGAVIGPNQRGWKFTLPVNQKVLSTSVTFANEIFFVAFSPDASGAAVCNAGVGRNFLYRISVKNGDPIGDLTAIVPGNEDQERVIDLPQGGIAPSPRFLFPSPEDPNCAGDECAPPPIGCVGVYCFDPDKKNNPVRTLWTQDGIE